MSTPTSCGYQGHEFGAWYPDSLCIEGYLWDADSDDGNGMLTAGGDIPCPCCNTAARLEDIRENIQDMHDPDTSQIAAWEHQIRKLIEINELAALEALEKIPRHVFWSYKRVPRPNHHLVDIEPDTSRTWPWPVPHLSAHQNLSIMRAINNKPGENFEASEA